MGGRKGARTLQSSVSVTRVTPAAYAPGAPRVTDPLIADVRPPHQEEKTWTYS